MRFRKTTQSGSNLADHGVDQNEVVTTDEVVEETRYNEDVVTDHRRSWYYESLPARVNSVLFAIMAAIVGLLALRFALIAFAANRSSGFVDFILDVSYVFMAPFNGAFADRTWDEGILEMDTLLAMGVWFIGFVLLTVLVNALLPKYDDSGSTVSRRSVTHS